MKNPPLNSVSLFWQHHAPFEMDPVHFPQMHLTNLKKKMEKHFIIQSII